MKTRVMLDLETLGQKPGSVIVSIGAVKFGGGEILSRFYERVDVESCMAIGLRMDASTVLWWMTQSDEARQELTAPARPLSAVLLALSEWLGPVADVELWGNGASFDPVLLGAAYDAATLPRPWRFWNERCYRTVKGLHPDIPAPRTGTHHNAVHDAETQARHLMAMLPGL